MKAVDVTDERLAASDCVVIVTDHAEFDYPRIVARARLVVDTRHVTWKLGLASERVVTL